ncbi:hypothetical protein ACIQBJ_05230 [Kitasatospora sp. NPDC088391]|uniref:hypothetical protein n=1 Tax=Kitasatospora sp. NPDC088391 TaxID=3364074 RepID=UPI0037FD7C61
MRRILACGAAAVLAAVLGGCASGAPDGGTPGPAAAPVTATAPPAGLFTAIPLPLDAYAETGDQVGVLTAGFNVLDHACMAAKGYDYPPAPYLRPLPPPALPANAMRYGEDTEQAAALTREDFGYYQTGHRGDPGGLTLSAAAHDAQAGRPGDGAGGCARQAADRLSANGGDYTRPAAVVGDLDRRSYLASLDDPRVKAAFTAWSACMGEHGHPAAAPAGQRTDTFGWPAGQRLADVACKRQVDLLRIWSEVETVVQQRLIDENRAALDAEQQRRAATLRNASAALAAP